MGKQINYWIEYESFLPVAQTALDSGCIIFKELDGKVTQSRDISIITKDDFGWYYFYLPEAGKIEIENNNGREYLSRGYNETSNSIIEAGFSHMGSRGGVKRICSERLYVISGYYNADNEWIPRPECMTKLYNKLVRVVKKIAPYTEMVDMKTSSDGKEFEVRYKEYVTPYCLDLKMNHGYMLSISL